MPTIICYYNDQKKNLFIFSKLDIFKRKVKIFDIDKKFASKIQKEITFNEYKNYFIFSLIHFILITDILDKFFFSKFFINFKFIYHSFI